MSSPIRAAFFDFDGTLLPFGAAALPASTVRALGRLRQNGVKVILATGCPPIHLPRMPMLRAVTLDGYVMMNGQYCFDETGVFRELALPAAGMQALVDWLHTPAGQQELVCFVERDFSYLNRPIGPGPGPVETDTPVLDPARALTHPTYQLNAYLHLNYRYMADYCRQHLPQFPIARLEGTYLAWMDCSVLGLTSDELEHRLLADARLWLNAGTMYGPEGEGFMRWNIACPRARLADALDRFRRFAESR